MSGLRDRSAQNTPVEAEIQLADLMAYKAKDQHYPSLASCTMSWFLQKKVCSIKEIVMAVCGLCGFLCGRSLFWQ